MGCACRRVTGGEFDELLSEPCLECLDFDSLEQTEPPEEPKCLCGCTMRLGRDGKWYCKSCLDVHGVLMEHVEGKARRTGVRL